MYWKDIWRIKNTIEVEIKYIGNYGARGEKRNQRTKATPEQIKKQNQKNKEKRMRRLIQANFDQGDYWLTLKYKKGERPPTETTKKDLKNFIDKMRRRFKKAEQEFKFIYRLEVGSKGGVHIHMIIPRIRGQDITDDIQSAWEKGRVNYSTLDGSDYQLLAEYITKPIKDEAYKQISFLEEKERKEFSKYSTSRNLIRPEPERKVYSKRTVRKILTEGIKPTEGYYIDKDSIVRGVNPFTGMSYLHYKERKLQEDGFG